MNISNLQIDRGPLPVRRGLLLGLIIVTAAGGELQAFTNELKGLVDGKELKEIDAEELNEITVSPHW